MRLIIIENRVVTWHIFCVNIEVLDMELEMKIKLQQRICFLYYTLHFQQCNREVFVSY